MNSEEAHAEYSEENSLALIVPQYTYDAKTFQLLRRKNSEEFNKILSSVSFRKDGYSITDAEDGASCDPNHSIRDENWMNSVHFIGNASTLTKLYTALYENRAFSQVHFAAFYQD